MTGSKETDALNTSSNRLLVCLMATAISMTLVNVSTLYGLIKRKKSKLFRYLLVMAVVDLMSCLVFVLQTILKINCDATDQCEKIHALSLVWIKAVNTELLLPSFSWNNVLVESYITVQRFLCVCSISNNALIRLKNASVWKVALLCGVLAFTIHLHRFSSRSVYLKTSRMNSTSYAASDFVRINNVYGQTSLFVVITSFFMGFKAFLMVVVLFFINIVTIFKLRIYLQRNKKGKSKPYS